MTFASFSKNDGSFLIPNQKAYSGAKKNGQRKDELGGPNHPSLLTVSVWAGWSRTPALIGWISYLMQIWPLTGYQSGFVLILLPGSLDSLVNSASDLRIKMPATRMIQISGPLLFDCSKLLPGKSLWLSVQMAGREVGLCRSGHCLNTPSVHRAPHEATLHQLLPLLFQSSGSAPVSCPASPLDWLQTQSLCLYLPEVNTRAIPFCSLCFLNFLHFRHS